MRLLPLLLLLLIGCAEARRGGGPVDFLIGCDIATGYAWEELDGGTCGPFEHLSACVPALNLDVSACTNAGQVECTDGTRWKWNVAADDAGRRVGRVSVASNCTSTYMLAPQ